MARIQLAESNGAYITEAGKNVLLKITKCNYDPEYGKVEMTLENEKGETLNNNFGLMAQDGSMNEGALKAFSYFSRVAMGDWGAQDVEDEDLIGKFIRADITMTEGKKPGKDGKTVSFANIEKSYMTNDKFENKGKAAATKAAPVQDEEDDEEWDD